MLAFFELYDKNGDFVEQDVVEGNPIEKDDFDWTYKKGRKRYKVVSYQYVGDSQVDILCKECYK